jgi:hypothetical protein
MDPECKCKNGYYKKNCPYTFEQGGSKFHCLGGDMRALPTEEGIESDSSWDTDSDNTGEAGIIDALKYSGIPGYKHPEPLKARNATAQGENFIQMEDEKKIQARLFQDVETATNYLGHNDSKAMRIDSAYDFIAANRATLNKFEALHLNGKSINDYSIGGFKINLETTTKKVKEIAPLPPNALPKIFIDDNLNFYHHFFKGMEMLLGGTKFQEIMDSRIHHEGTIEKLPDSIIGFMESGMCSGDTALTLLVKKVLSSTFSKSQLIGGDDKISVLTVDTNLWGFRYIEPGMTLADADIKMWLSNCYSHYRTIWFDTFKSSGVPAFAVEGVIINTTRPVLKMETQIRQQKVQDTPNYSNDDRSLIRSEYRDRKRHQQKPSRKGSWF